MKTAVVICPGRGTYTKTELGVLGRHFHDKALLANFDARRAALGQETLSALDGAASYSVAKHTRGDNGSALIYAATLADFRAIEGVEVVAVTGNSMGWYSALACGGALTPEGGFEVVNTMGTLMQERLIGGQIIYPFMGEDWLPDPTRKAEIMAVVADIGARPDHVLGLSIDLGGMLVLAGNEAGLKAFEAAVPPVQGRFPMRLANHAGFHTAMQVPVAEAGRARLAPGLFAQPKIPMIDGRGHIWWPGACDLHALWDYTLGHQVVEPYDFTRAIAHAAREFAPDLFIVTGPGTTLGGAVAQSLILADWRGMRSKSDFQSRQSADPLLVSMGMEDQRRQVTKGD
ncbi:malonyl CoA-acyl carrier protein transacylase [Gemmobacter caeni]|uniref:[acyl-carrier-protein] S-malonyltransferase n=1 Tax=Gemmobacter caeni TaxID=589035 RepID=A0A2T6B6E5_9RHOB|nr:ACP S-malonyltransferase [Gemmobacter caeni]PTX51649.1 malonyl CoA-acyl carrier protein transacylase [Gemmobacter caeni]TWJ03777.1 malonyl CoA-acyl carrier protein transacylase [Gemmobacter caeni]